MSFQAAPDGEIPIFTALALMQRLLALSHSKREYGFTRTQIGICAALLSGGAMNMTQLANYISASKEQTTRALAPLADAGLVERFEQPDNRTRVYVRLTEEGRRYVKERWAELKGNVEQRLAASVTAEEREALDQAVRVLIDVLKKVR